MCPDGAVPSDGSRSPSAGRTDRIDSKTELESTDTIIPGPRRPHPPAADPPAAAPSRIGPYALLEVLGEGGMGIVYLAEQREPIRRVVALKVVNAARHSDTIAARFETERQVLALMRHPGIAQVYDAGTTPDGNPYFVMEYVAGVPITDFCDRERLPLKSRLELFVEVCRAIQHAHQKGVIHRDIKSQNVLVATEDGKPVPKVIDFGIAKAVGDHLDTQATVTRLDQVLGTPAYMSPEQADRSLTPDVDTRADVYSLGVLLYKLLVGAYPLDLDRSSSFVERIVSEDPPTPGARLARLGAGAAAVAAARRTDPAALARQLAGDLDWIAMKALEKDRADRYAAVSELAADVERHLRDEPVLAGPPTLSYRVRKYIRRHKMGATAAALVLASLVAGVIGTSFGLVRSLKAEERARREAEKARAVSDFLADMLAAPAAGRAGREVRVVEVLDRASGALADLHGEPEVEGAVRATLGQTYLELGEVDKARSQLDAALAIQQRALGPDHPETLDTAALRARLTFLAGDVPGGEAAVREVLARQERALGPGDPRTFGTLRVLARILGERGEQAESRALVERLLERQRAALGPEHPETLESGNVLARVLVGQGEFAQAERVARETLAAQRRVLGEDHTETLSTANTLAGALFFQDKVEELEPILARALEVKSRVLGPEHPEVLDLQHNLVAVLHQLERLDEAEPLARATLDARQRLLGPEHPRTLDSTFILAQVLEGRGQREEGLALLRETLAVQTRVLGPRHPSTLNTAQTLALTLAGAGLLAEAEAGLTQVFAGRDASLGPAHVSTLSTLRHLAELRLVRGRPAEARALYRDLARRAATPEPLAEAARSLRERLAAEPGLAGGAEVLAELDTAAGEARAKAAGGR